MKTLNEEKNKLVSVIITSYGGSNTLCRAIDSILEQTCQCFEVIVVDDNDPNTNQRFRTSNMMKKYINDNRVKYIKHKHNINGSAARNTGINSAKGAYITFLDDDDYLYPDRLELAVKVLE